MAETQTPDTPAPTAVDTQAPIATETPVAESILADLGMDDKAQEDDKKGEEPKTEPAEAKAEEGEDDEAIIRQRADYLKHKQKLTEREKELAAKEAALAKAAEEQNAKKEGDPAKVEEFVPFSVPFDPETMKYDSDNEKTLAVSLKSAADEIATLQNGLRYMASLVIPMLQERQSNSTQTVQTAVTAGIQSIEQEYGVSVSEGDIATALQAHGQRLYEQFGEVSAKLVVEAWKRENVDVILHKKQATPAPKPKENAPPMPGGEQTPQPARKANMTAAEMIAADLEAAGIA